MSISNYLFAEFLKFRRKPILFALFLFALLYPVMYGLYLPEETFSFEYSRWAESRQIESLKIFLISKIISSSSYAISVFFFFLVSEIFWIDSPSKSINLSLVLPVTKKEVFSTKILFLLIWLCFFCILHIQIIYFLFNYLQTKIISLDKQISYSDCVFIGLHILISSTFYTLILLFLNLIHKNFNYFFLIIAIFMVNFLPILPNSLFLQKKFLLKNSFLNFPLWYWFLLCIISIGLYFLWIKLWNYPTKSSKK